MIAARSRHCLHMAACLLVAGGLAGWSLPAFARLDSHASQSQSAPPDRDVQAHVHAAHASPATSDGHAGHDGHANVMDQQPAASHPSPSPPAPSTARAPPTQAELQAAFPDLHGMDMRDHMDDDPLLATLLFDRLERQHGADDAGTAWELQGWVGGLENRVWLRSEGERIGGHVAHGDVELLWGRPTGPWWDMLAGVRHDLGPGPSRDWLAVGVQGLAPYKFEVSATAYLGPGGRFGLRAEAEYELLLTNRLVLQPRLEANAYSRDDPARGIGKGISDASLGLRLRYELHRQFAPYAGYEWSRRFGRTSRLAEQAGGDFSEGQWVAGVRFWF